MTLKAIASTCIAAAMIVGPVQQAAADNALVGGIVGGIIGGVIVNEATKNRNAAPRTTTRSTASTSQRAANRETQVALNYFGFPVGTPDGALGPRSRAAITEYQVVMGFPATGDLNSFERDLLVGSYYRAQSGGYATSQQIAADPRGVRGLLITYRDEKLGVAPPAGQFAATPANPQPATTVPQFAAAAPALPSFMGQGVTQASLASHCNKVSLVTNSNGGFVTQVTMSDPGFALSEQFCLARTYAITQGEDLSGKVAGFTPQQITQQCEGFGPVLKDHVASLSVKALDDVVAGVQGFVLSSGMAPAQLAGTAKICLGVGYVTDNMDVAIGSALILAAVGEKPYAELVGHHLMQGMGTAQRVDLAMPWYDMGLDATEAGATQVFAPGMTDRGALIRLAAYSVAGKPLPGGSVPMAPVPAGLPTFGVPKNVANP